MALHLHLGPSGSGKSTAIYKTVMEEAGRNFSVDFPVIVPEQFTLQTQRYFISEHPQHGIMNIDILSFVRLAHRVFEELGVRPPVVLEDSGKSMIVKKVALDSRQQLGIYAGKVGSQGFISRMKSVIAEFYQYGIGPEELEQMTQLADGRPQLKAKLKDIGIIYDGFKRFIDGRFIMNEEILNLLAEKAPESKLLKGAVLTFDGFTGFTAPQLNVLEAILPMAKDIHISLTIDEREIDSDPDEESLFYLSLKTILKLESLADRTGVKVVIHRYDKCFRFADSPALAALERNIFRYPSGTCGNHEGIDIVSCDSPVSEVRYVISRIMELVRNENYRYGEIAVVSGATESYSRIVDREFERAGIPCFLDRKRGIAGTAAVEMLRALIETARTDFAYESIFRFIKSCHSGIGNDDSAVLENYCLACGIRGRRMWSRDWTRSFRTAYPVDLERINGLRARIFGTVGEAVGILASKDVTVRERIEALKGVLVSCGVEEKLETLAAAQLSSTNADERLAARENGQLWECIMKVFERIETLLGDDVIPLKEFSEILDTGFAEAKLALLPQGADSVVIGDIERTRLNGIRALFFVGVNDGIIPGSGADAGLLSDNERNVFADNDIELSPTNRQTAYLSEFYLYLNLTKPSGKLFLSYHRMNEEKSAGRPAYLIAKLKKLYPGLEVRHIYGDDPGLLVGTDKGAATTAELLRDADPKKLAPAQATIVEHFRLAEPERFTHMLEAAFYTPARERMSAENAAGLYSRVLTGSVTLMEKYASCAFAHFAQFGLRLEERPEYQIGGIELGNIYHKALELYCTSLKASGQTWHGAEEGLKEELRGRALTEALAEYADILGDSKRNEYIRVRVGRVLKRTIDVLDFQIKSGSFEPQYFEENFTHSVSFMALRGKIDRMDICEKGGKRYLRIIDYKSGAKDFDLTKLFYGLQIQLAVYMVHGMEKLRDGLPAAENISAGIYYYNIDDPLIECSADRAPEKILSQLRLKGPSNSDCEPLILQDVGLEGEDGKLTGDYTSRVIRVKTKKIEDPKAPTAFDERSTKKLDREQLEALGTFVEKQILRQGREIMEGNIEVNPYQLGNETPCGYCAYSGVCGFDTKLGSRPRKLKKCKEGDIWEQLNGVPNSSR